MSHKSMILEWNVLPYYWWWLRMLLCTVFTCRKRTSVVIHPRSHGYQFHLMLNTRTHFLTQFIDRPAGCGTKNKQASMHACEEIKHKSGSIHLSWFLISSHDLTCVGYIFSLTFTFFFQHYDKSTYAYILKMFLMLVLLDIGHLIYTIAF